METGRRGSCQAGSTNKPVARRERIRPGSHRAAESPFQELVPKLCLGTQLSEKLYFEGGRGANRCPACRASKHSFSPTGVPKHSLERVRYFSDILGSLALRRMQSVRAWNAEGLLDGVRGGTLAVIDECDVSLCEFNRQYSASLSWGRASQNGVCLANRGLWDEIGKTFYTIPQGPHADSRG